MDWKRTEPEIYNSSLKFAVVRNPYDRLVSAYLFIVKRQLSQHKKIIEKYGQDFGAFVRGCRGDFGIKISEVDMVAFPQHGWVTDESGSVVVDDVGRFEELDAFWDRMSAKHGFPRKRLPHLNKSFGGNFRDFYNSEIASIVADEYGHDFELFGYGLESWHD